MIIVIRNKDTPIEKQRRRDHESRIGCPGAGAKSQAIELLRILYGTGSIELHFAVLPVERSCAPVPRPAYRDLVVTSGNIQSCSGYREIS